MWFEARRLRQLTIEAADRVARTVWSGCFSLLGRCNPSALSVRAIVATGGSTILTIAPHPDDEVLGCGLAIADHLRRHDRVHVAIVTDGGQSGSATPTERLAEARRAAQTLGAECRILGLPEGGWHVADGATLLYDLLVELQPAVVYAPSSVDYHPEHKRVAHALAAALERLAGSLDIRVYEIGVPLTPALVNRIAEADGHASRKHEALAAYSSQFRAVAPVTRLHHYNRLLYRRPEDLEVFWEMTSPEYVRMIGWMARSDKDRDFHGVRGRAFRDPLCYLVGLRRRIDLARATYGDR